MEHWHTRWVSQFWLNSVFKKESDFIDHGFSLFDECISMYNCVNNESPNVPKTYTEICATISVKARRLVFGCYSLTMDGLAQESGALLRVLVETYELLVYVRLDPSRAYEVKNNKTPTAGKIAKIIGSDFKQLREHLNNHASHFSYSEEATRHLRDSDTGLLNPIAIHGKGTFLRNLSSIWAFMATVLFESVSCLGQTGMDIENLANKFDKWNREGFDVFDRVIRKQ